MRGGGNSLPHWRVCGCVWLKKRALFFFCSVRGGGKFTHSLAHPGARFFFCSVHGGGNSLTHWRVHGCVWFLLLFARRGKFTHSLARPGARFFFAVCAAVDIHSLTGASGGDSLTHWRVRGRVFFFASCAAGEIHSLTGASAAVCGWNRGRVFFLLRARRGKFTPSLARLRLCVVEKAGAFFFLLRARQGEIHSLTGASGGAFFFCSVRGGGNSLTHWRVHGCVWFFLLFARGKFTHSLARPGARFFFAVCAAVDIHSLTGASGGDSLTHWRVRGRVFFFAPCAVGEIHSLTGASAAVCGWNRGRVFFFCSVRGGPSKKKNTGRVFLVRHAAGRAKKNFFLERAEQKKHIFQHVAGCTFAALPPENRPSARQALRSLKPKLPKP